MSDLHDLVCPACGSEHLHWELHRLRSRTATIQMRVIHWLCRDCGQAWLMPAAPTPREVEESPYWGEITPLPSRATGAEYEARGAK